MRRLQRSQCDSYKINPPDQTRVIAASCIQHHFPSLPSSSSHANTRQPPTDTEHLDSTHVSRFDHFRSLLCLRVPGHINTQLKGGRHFLVIGVSLFIYKPCFQIPTWSRPMTWKRSKLTPDAHYGSRSNDSYVSLPSWVLLTSHELPLRRLLTSVGFFR